MNDRCANTEALNAYMAQQDKEIAREDHIVRLTEEKLEHYAETWSEFEQVGSECVSEDEHFMGIFFEQIKSGNRDAALLGEQLLNAYDKYAMACAEHEVENDIEMEDEE